MLASPAERQREESSVIGAVVDVLDAGQRVLLDRIELVTVETKAAVADSLASLALLLFGLGLLFVGWIGANISAVLLLERFLWSRPEAVGLVTLVNFVLAGVALLLARRRGKKVAEVKRPVAATMATVDGGIVE